MDGASRRGGDARPSVRESLSVVALAVRLRLAGSATTPPRAMAWRRIAHDFLLMLLLLNAIGDTNFYVRAVSSALMPTVDRQIYDLTPWDQAYPALMFAAFVSLVLAWNQTARMLLVLGVTIEIGYRLVIWVIAAPPGGVAISPGSLVVRAVMLALLVLLVMVLPYDARPSRRFWFTAYLAGAALGLFSVLQWQ